MNPIDLPYTFTIKALDHGALMRDFVSFESFTLAQWRSQEFRSGGIRLKDKIESKKN